MGTLEHIAVHYVHVTSYKSSIMYYDLFTMSSTGFFACFRNTMIIVEHPQHFVTNNSPYSDNKTLCVPMEQ